MRGGVVHCAGWLVNPIARACRATPIIKAALEDVEIGWPEMSMRRIHLPRRRIDQNMEEAGFLVDTQNLDFVANPVVNPFELPGTDQRRIKRVEVTLRSPGFFLARIFGTV